MNLTVRKTRAVVIAGLLVACSGVAATAQTITDLQTGFDQPPNDAKIMMRWWWFGPAVTKPELEREMRLMKEGGIGGFEVQAVYPLSPDEPTAGIKNLPYLSDEFIDALRFVSAKAKELGLRMDLTLGSGWPYGGPSVAITDAAATLLSALGPFHRVAPLRVAIDALEDGIARRARRIVAPKRAAPLLPLRMLAQPVVDRFAQRNLAKALEIARGEDAPLTTPQVRV